MTLRYSISKHYVVPNIGIRLRRGAACYPRREPSS